MSIITVERKVLEKNDEIARRNRALFSSKGIFVINLVSSPGSGKTSILERTLEFFNRRVKLAVIEGDVQTDFDAQRIAHYDTPVVQIVTNGGCHLEAKLIEDALGNLDLSGIKLLIIENVGNLVCPSNYDLGEALKVVVASTTEGDDKPLKVPRDVSACFSSDYQQDRPSPIRQLRYTSPESKRSENQSITQSV